MKLNNKIRIAIILLALGGLLLGACSPKSADPTPTLSLEEVQTQAVMVFSSGLTQTAAALPTSTLTPTWTSTATETSTPLPPSPTSTSVLPTDSCYSLAFLSDVTIPDNTVMAPGEQFTKTWSVRNNGSCEWEAGFKLAFTTGDPLGGTTLILTEDISPGATTNLSIFMTAPADEGTYQSNWRMSGAGGAYFGDEMYTIIEVGSGGNTLTPSATTDSATATPDPSPTETPTP